MQKMKDVCTFLRKKQGTERLLLCLLACFPLAHITPHPTALIGLAVILLQAACAAEYGKCAFFSREGGTRACLLLCALLVFYGIVGYGKIADACTVALMLSLCIPARAVLSERKAFRRACVCVGIGGLFTSLYGIFQYYFGNLTVKWVDMRHFSDIGGRVTSVFDNPNVLSVYLLFCFPLALIGLGECEKRHTVRVFCAVTAASVAACTLLTWTRGAWLGMLLEGGLFLFLYSKRTRKILLFSPCFLPLLAAAAPPQILRRFLSIGSLADSSNLYRVHTWRGVLRTLARHPLGIGVGEQAFRSVYPRYAVMGTATVMHAHNVYLQFAIETGALGGALFLFWVAGALWRARHSTHVLPLAGLAVMGLFDHLWYAPSMACLFACAVTLARQSPRKDTKRRQNVSILHEKI